MCAAHVVLDEVQLKRIQAMHRGFLYQHLYAVGILLMGPQSDLKELVVEHDQDIELITEKVRRYIQVKSRAESLGNSDISDTLTLFSDLRNEHIAHRRSLDPQFFVVSNVPPTPSLDKSTKTWHQDTHLITPKSKITFENILPPAWPDITAAISWCETYANKIPFGSLSGSTLIWKLAGTILLASSGAKPTTFLAAQLPSLFEQIVTQLHRFPVGPAKYRPHNGEPDFPGSALVDLIVGFSGAGKTTWAADGSSRCGELVGYFDVGDMLSSAVPPSLARELAALIFTGERDEIKKLMLPGASGLQSLRGIDSFLEKHRTPLIVVVDNAHKMNPSDLSTLVKVMPTAKWILLAQPWPGKAAVEASLNVSAKTLGGWGLRDIAEEFGGRECALDPVQSERVNRLTGGLPLYVQSLAKICQDAYACDAAKLLDQLEEATHPKTTGQEQILLEVQKQLSPKAITSSAVLSISDLPLTDVEARRLLVDGLRFTTLEATACLRELEGWGVVEFLRDGRLTMHDSYRLLAQNARLALDADTVRQAKNSLIAILLRSRDLDRVRLLCRLLPEVGRTEELVDFATASSEYFHERGMSQEFESILENAASSKELSPTDRFWALDTVVFWNLQSGNIAKAKNQLLELEMLVADSEPNARQLLAVAMKKMLVSGHKRDYRGVDRQFKEASALSKEAEYQRILRYNYAMCLFKFNDFERSQSICSNLIIEYYDVLGLELSDVISRNPPDILKKIKKTNTYLDDAKRLADALNLNARNIERSGEDPKLNRIHALKFYSVSDSRISAVGVARDLVDEFLDRGDAIGAKLVVETTLLPLFPHGEALDLFVPIHSQYAVVLAYCGELKQARKTIAELHPFLQASPQWRSEIANQRDLIEKIGRGEVRLPGAPARILQPTGKAKLGRNEPCSCGSGLKFKKCCGK
jgi:hypothetical protein